MPRTGLNVAALTDKDLADLEWTAKHAVEYVGLSFVRKAEDVALLRSELQRRGIRARIIAKIEKPQALANLEAIIAEADAVMVARGDLGVELDVIRVPGIQKQIIEACHRARVPVITATQMLNSMESSSRPTRAEASDVFNAVLDGTDAVMLSGETAIGEYPVEAVSMMSQIAHEAESLYFSELFHTRGAENPVGGERARDRGKRSRHRRKPWCRAGGPGPAHHRERRRGGEPHFAALKAALLLVATSSGRTALVLSKHRNPAPTIAVSKDPQTVRAMSLYWGVTPLPRPDVASRDELARVCGRVVPGTGSRLYRRQHCRYPRLVVG